MSCDNFIYYLGSTSDTTDNEIESNEFNTYIRAIIKLLSFLIFLIMTIYMIFFRCFHKEKHKKQLNALLETSIFSYLSDLNNELLLTSFPVTPKSLDNNEKNFDSNAFQSDGRSTSQPSFELAEMMMIQRGLESSMKRHTFDEQNDFEIAKETYIFNFHECFCECLCEFWLKKIYQKYVLSFFKAIHQKATKLIHKHLMFLCFYGLMVGGFFYYPLRNIGSFFVNECNREAMNNEEFFWFLRGFFSILDLICGALSLVLFLFTISFLGTKNEFLKSYLFDKGYRARFIYFHFKKAWIFGFLYIFFKVLYKIGFFYDFSLTDGLDSQMSLIYFIFIDIFLLSNIKLQNGFSTAPIDQDCSLLRAHAKYFAIQNCLLHGMPRARDVYEIIKKEAKGTLVKKKKNPMAIGRKSRFFIEKEDSFLFDNKTEKKPILSFLNNKDEVKLNVLEEKLTKKCIKLGKNLNEQLTIIERQRFKNLTKSKGFAQFLPVFLFGLMTLDIVLTTIFSIFILIKLYNPSLYLLQMVRISRVGCTLISIFECSGMPILIFYCLKKRAFFEAIGYGEQNFSWKDGKGI